MGTQEWEDRRKSGLSGNLSINYTHLQSMLVNF